MPLPDDFRQQCFAAFRTAAAEGRLFEVAGARAALERIGLPKAVASSSSREGLIWKLRTVGLLHLFGDHTYGREDVDRAKPAPDIYLYAAEKLAAAPSRCLVIEDSETGVQAAQAAGMTVWRFFGGSHFHQHDGAATNQGLSNWDAVAERLA